MFFCTGTNHERFAQPRVQPGSGGFRWSLHTEKPLHTAFARSMELHDGAPRRRRSSLWRTSSGEVRRWLWRCDPCGCVMDGRLAIETQSPQKRARLHSARFHETLGEVSWPLECPIPLTQESLHIKKESSDPRTTKVWTHIVGGLRPQCRPENHSAFRKVLAAIALPFGGRWRQQHEANSQRHQLWPLHTRTAISSFSFQYFTIWKKDTPNLETFLLPSLRRRAAHAGAPQTAAHCALPHQRSA